MKIKMPENWDGLLTLNGNILCSIDIETTGRDSGTNEIIQIAVQPIDAYFEPLNTVLPFYLNLIPENMNSIDSRSTQIHGLSLDILRKTGFNKWKAADLLDEWFQKLNLPFRKCIVPLAHNWAFEAGFLKAWLGLETFQQLFHPHPRDTMLLAVAINDRAIFRGQRTVFTSFGLGALCNHFGIPFIGHHDALADALATTNLYKALMLMEL